MTCSRWKADKAGNVGEIGSVKPGQTKALKLKLAAGHYALLCNLPATTPRASTRT